MPYAYYFSVFVQEKRFSFFSKERGLAEDSCEQVVESGVLAVVAFFLRKSFLLTENKLFL